MLKILNKQLRVFGAIATANFINDQVNCFSEQYPEFISQISVEEYKSIVTKIVNLSHANSIFDTDNIQRLLDYHMKYDILKLLEQENSLKEIIIDSKASEDDKLKSIRFYLLKRK